MPFLCKQSVPPAAAFYDKRKCFRLISCLVLLLIDNRLKFAFKFTGEYATGGNTFILLT